jgi:hypothetical protein
MMRRILVNYAIMRNRDKRGGGEQALPLEETIVISNDDGDEDLLALDAALTRLEKLDHAAGARR